MKRPKLSVGLYINITYEMAMWIDSIVREAGATRPKHGDGRGPIVRSMLQTLMDEDKQAHSEAPKLEVVK